MNGTKRIIFALTIASTTVFGLPIITSAAELKSGQAVKTDDWCGPCKMEAGPDEENPKFDRHIPITAPKEATRPILLKPSKGMKLDGVDGEAS